MAIKEVCSSAEDQRMKKSIAAFGEMGEGKRILDVGKGPGRKRALDAVDLSHYVNR